MKRLKLVKWLSAIAVLLFPLASTGLVEALSAQWNPVGTYNVDFTCTAVCSGTYSHVMDITNYNPGSGNLSGHGNYVADPSYTWNLTGNLSGSALAFHLLYTGTNAGYTLDATGTVANNGTLSGTASDSSGQAFTWASTSGAATASKIKDFDSDKNLDKSQCSLTKKSKEVVDVNYKLINDYDSGVGGNNWANDTINRELQIWSTPTNTYCAIVNDDGNIVTFAGISPNASGTVAAGVKGVMDGGYVTDQITGTQVSNPAYKTHGNLGTFDLQCNINPVTCPGAHPSVDSYVTGWDGNFTWWGWEYNTCQNGNWVNSVDGNFGDITGSVQSQNNKQCHQDKDHGGNGGHNDGHHDKNRHCGVRF